VITNDGNEPLHDLTVVDDNGTPTDPSDDFALTDADCNRSLAGPLAPGEAITCLATGAATAGQYGNVGTVTGVSPNDEVVRDDDPSHYWGADPDIELLKLVSQETVVQGQPFTYTLRITNTGNVSLSPVVLTDTLPAEINYVVGSGNPAAPDVLAEPLLVWEDLGTLSPGESLMVSFVVTASYEVTGTLVNTADVAGTYAGRTVTDEDDVPVEVVKVPPVSAVDLRYFRATSLADGIRLEWATAVEVDNFGFRVLRGTSSDITRAAELAFVPTLCRGNFCGAEYDYLDTKASPDASYWYWLVDVDTLGQETFHGPVRALIGTSAMPYKLYMPLLYAP
jgi:uncharacterized repeat protein (TIGR01451 family)